MKALYELLIYVNLVARSIHVSTIFQKEQLQQILFKNYFLFLSNIFIYLFLAVWGSLLCMLFLVVVCKLLIAAVSPVAVYVSFSSCAAQA